MSAATLNAAVDLIAEHLACESMGPKAVRWLLRQGVPATALFVQDCIPTLCTDVIFGRNRFEFARHRGSDEARPAFIWPAFDAHGYNADLGAWRPPADVGLWLGNVAMFGEEQLDPSLRDEPLQVHAGVLDWLRAGRRGVVVIDERRAVPLLREVGPLVVDDIDFGERLKHRLMLKPPKILIRAASLEKEAA